MRHGLSRVLAPNLSVAQRRRWVKRVCWLNPKVKQTASRDGTLAKQPVTWIRPTQDEGHALLLYVHGGAFVAGSPRSHQFLPALLAREARMSALLPAYALAPERPYPAALHELLTVYRALSHDAGEQRAIILGGDSAGGMLALQLMMALRDEGLPAPRAALLISPVADVIHLDGPSYTEEEGRDPWFDRATLEPLFRMYTHGADPSDPALCPKSADLSGLPPMHVEVGQREVLRSDAEQLVARARQAGVAATLHVAPELWHVYASFGPYLPESRQALARMTAWLRRVSSA